MSFTVKQNEAASQKASNNAAKAAAIVNAVLRRYFGLQTPICRQNLL